AAWRSLVLDVPIPLGIRRHHPRHTLTDLRTRRQLVGDHLESCVLAMQNVRFDLLRLRSAGVAVALDDLTRATQQARALSRDVDHVIAAAGEIKQALGEQPGA